ncbi:hypothetical protein [Pseudobutyrivibrio xylanivorans]|uniref:Uncharacterized protein n=1 Tax=Pseudobutyrivibrio xylanivorans TaxID=185007 RepID=A0A5P6VPF2_PSEXY|nr:hypothetical protein [Pseudobutyrivibrio xylanivorans]QFJ54330.1 hypothetical protein FXF36_05415 [Pseudobutyrivibrio xylanivorans]
MNKQIDLKELLEGKLQSLEPIEEAIKAIEAADLSVPKNLMFSAESAEFKPETKPVTLLGSKSMTVEEAKAFNDEMNRFIDTVLISGVDYGVIPHCSKPTILKSGAEKIMNYLGLIARTEIVNRVEDYEKGFFSYEIKVFLIDYNGVVKGEGIATSNTRESKYAKQNGFTMQNVVLKMAKKRALVDGILNVGNLSARFTQDVEDMEIEGSSYNSSKGNTVSNTMPSVATEKQIKYLELLMNLNNVTEEAMKSYLRKHYGIEDYHCLSGVQISEIIKKFNNATK